MNSKVYCMMTSGLPLSEFAADALYNTARKMVKNGKKQCSLLSDDAKGVVTTDLETTIFVSMGGVAFDADIVTPKGQTKVSFFMRTSDLVAEEEEKAVWSQRSHRRSVPSVRKRRKNDSYKWN